MDIFAHNKKYICVVATLIAFNTRSFQILTLSKENSTTTSNVL